MREYIIFSNKATLQVFVPFHPESLHFFPFPIPLLSFFHPTLDFRMTSFKIGPQSLLKSVELFTNTLIKSKSLKPLNY